jgi:hypothetical protein
MIDDHTHRGDDVHSFEAAMEEANGGWQPIKTAPRNGHTFLGFVDTDCRVMMWHPDWEDWSDLDGSIVGYPTHWMPLPAAPTEGE